MGPKGNTDRLIGKYLDHYTVLNASLADATKKSQTLKECIEPNLQVYQKSLTSLSGDQWAGSVSKQAREKTDSLVTELSRMNGLVGTLATGLAKCKVYQESLEILKDKDKIVEDFRIKYNGLYATWFGLCDSLRWIPMEIKVKDAERRWSDSQDKYIDIPAKYETNPKYTEAKENIRLAKEAMDKCETQEYNPAFEKRELYYTTEVESMPEKVLAETSGADTKKTLPYLSAGDTGAAGGEGGDGGAASQFIAALIAMYSSGDPNKIAQLESMGVSSLIEKYRRGELTDAELEKAISETLSPEQQTTLLSALNMPEYRIGYEDSEKEKVPENDSLFKLTPEEHRQELIKDGLTGAELEEEMENYTREYNYAHGIWTGEEEIAEVESPPADSSANLESEWINNADGSRTLKKGDDITVFTDNPDGTTTMVRNGGNPTIITNNADGSTTLRSIDEEYPYGRLETTQTYGGGKESTVVRIVYPKSESDEAFVLGMAKNNPSSGWTIDPQYYIDHPKSNASQADDLSEWLVTEE